MYSDTSFTTSTDKSNFSDSDSDDLDQFKIEYGSDSDSYIPSSYPKSIFEENINSNSLAFLPNYEKYKYLEFSNNIIIPHYILKKIQDKSDNIEFPIFFELFSMNYGMPLGINCTGSDFLEGIDKIYIPNRIMSNLLLEEGESVYIKYIKDIKKGEKIKIRPHTSDFLDLEDHKQLLESKLINNYNILTKGETIEIEISGETYFIDIVETYPDIAINICNTDIEVDFDTPLDFKEKPILKPEILKKKDDEKNDEIKKEEEDGKKFIPFSGIGRRLGD